MKNKTFTQKSAFTLAEVLITLGIIGVVAAMTLPTLIQNYKKKTYIEGLKTGISLFSQGFRKMLADEGVDSLGNTETWKNCYENQFNTSSGRETCEPILSKYFKVVKFQSQSDFNALGDTSGNYPDTAICQNLVGETNKWWYLNDKTKCVGEVDSFTVTLSNGMRAYLWLDNENAFDYEAGYMYLDINGEKGPNTWGRDVFQLKILINGNVVGYNDGQYAKAYAEYKGESVDRYREIFKKGTERDCSPTTTTFGYACSGRIINDGWKMNY